MPALGIDGLVIAGDGREQLKLGEGQHVGIGLPAAQELVLERAQEYGVNSSAIWIE